MASHSTGFLPDRVSAELRNREIHLGPSLEFAQDHRCVSYHVGLQFDAPKLSIEVGLKPPISCILCHFARSQWVFSLQFSESQVPVDWEIGGSTPNFTFSARLQERRQGENHRQVLSPPFARCAGPSIRRMPCGSCRADAPLRR